MNPTLDKLRSVIQTDVGGRGLAKVPGNNLFTVCEPDFEAACRSIAGASAPSVAILTGFVIPTTDPLVGETDGPPGALFLARVLHRLGIPVALLTDAYSLAALRVGLEHCRIDIPLREMPPASEIDPFTHLIAIERVGPAADGKCYTMRGRDVTDLNGRMHELVETFSGVTIGIGDGGNEIGMGKIPPEVIAANIPMGDRIACRVRTDHLIVAGISNWGGYALGIGIAHFWGKRLPFDEFGAGFERSVVSDMVTIGGLVDGVLGVRAVSVDGLEFGAYGLALEKLLEISCVGPDPG